MGPDRSAAAGGLQVRGAPVTIRRRTVARASNPPAFSVAPMMDRTDRHFRYLARLVTRRALLYTEMIVADAVIHGDRDRLLGFDPVEHPVVVQLGGSDPKTMARAARIAAAFGYDAVNVNVGCPSDRVRSGAFGACLMRTPEKVAEIVAAIRDAVDVPVTVKHRIGVDERDRYEDMLAFVDRVAVAGCRHFTVHARKAWLSGLSPKENRTIPPLRHPEVHRLKAERPHLWIETNGGIGTVAEVRDHLAHVDGVMVGRAFYDAPLRFASVDAEIFGEPSRRVDLFDVLGAMDAYARRFADRPADLRRIARHVMGLCAGVPGARTFRRVLGEHAFGPSPSADALARATDALFRVLEARRDRLAEGV